jgi:hypothetical protein
MATITQRSFSGGEISPSLYARVDFSKYQVGLKQCRNFIVQKHGGAANRAGTQYINETKIDDKVVRFLPFIFNRDQTYVLEFGLNYIRFIKDGRMLMLAPQLINSYVNVMDVIVTVTSHGLTTGDEIYFSNSSNTNYNNRNFIVETVDLDSFKLKFKDGSYLQFEATTGGQIEKIYEIESPYIDTDLVNLQYTQSADVVTIVGKGYEPRELKRLSELSWSLDLINFKSDVQAPFDADASGTAGSTTREYKITSIRKDDYKESNAAIGAFTTTISSITNANPARVTLASLTGQTLNEGDEIYLEVVGMSELNQRRFTITNISGLEFDLSGEDSTTYGTFTSGDFYFCFVRISTGNITASTPVTVSWKQDETITQVQEYNIYRRDDLAGSFGAVGVSKGKTFKDVGATPDSKVTPPNERNPFLKTADYPSVITYFQQRLFLANTQNDVEKIFSSKIGDFKNFGVSSPIQDDDAITFKISGRQVNEVRHLLDLGKLVAFTSGGEYIINGNDASAITPTSVNTQQQSYNGASFLSPLVINDTALYVQDRGSVVRDIAFRFESDGYSGDDLTIFAFHLFEGFTLVDWTYQQVPHSVVWAVRSDGVLLGLTYLKERRILAWHRHDFQGGKVENVCTVPENDEDALYVVINRDGKRYMERMATRQVFDIVDCKYLDSHLSFDGRNTDATTMTLSGGTTWEYEEEITLTSSAAFFNASDVGNKIVFNNLRLEITEFTSSTVVKVKPHKTVPVEFRDTAITDWKKAIDEISGLWHLEGKQVSVLGDGFVLANPNNPSYDVLTVTDGKITLDKPYSVVHVGLPYTSDIETLSVDTPNGESIADKKQIFTSVNVFVEKSRGGFVGEKPPLNDGLDGLFEFKVRNEEDYDSPVELRTGTMETTIDGAYDDNGRVFLRQTDPLPFTVLSIQPAGMYPFRG